MPSAYSAVIADNWDPRRYGFIEMRPGEHRRLRILHLNATGPPSVATHPVSWRVEPRAPATIDGDGLLEVSAASMDGAQFQVAATVGSQCDLLADVRVYELERHPLVGLWSEAGQVLCAGGAEVPAGSRYLREVVFWSGGEFQVTHIPFESVVDYCGRFATRNGELLLDIEAALQDIEEVDPVGAFEFDDEGDLRVLDMWLRLDRRESRVCGHRLVRWEEFRGF